MVTTAEKVSTKTRFSHIKGKLEIRLIIFPILPFPNNNINQKRRKNFLSPSKETVYLFHIQKSSLRPSNPYKLCKYPKSLLRKKIYVSKKAKDRYFEGKHSLKNPCVELIVTVQFDLDKINSKPKWYVAPTSHKRSRQDRVSPDLIKLQGPTIVRVRMHFGVIHIYIHIYIAYMCFIYIHSSQYGLYIITHTYKW